MPQAFKWQLWAKRAAWTWAALLLLACLMPSEEVPQVDVPFADKWVHFVLFGGQTFLALLALKRPSPKAIFGTVVLCILFGALVEILQLITHQWLHRAFETTDIFADAVGVLLGWVLYLFFRKNFWKTAATPE